MKFGPEWLRNMSNDMGTSGGGGGISGGNVGGSNNSNNNNSSSISSFSNIASTSNMNSINILNSSSTNMIPGAPRHQLAEFRYGREEMLSLFDKSIGIPDILPKFKKLFIEKIQCPLALTPSTEEEVVRIFLWIESHQQH